MTGGPYFDHLHVGQVFDTAPSMTLTPGVAAVHQAAAPGVYKGLDVTIVTTDFGVRR